VAWRSFGLLVGDLGRPQGARAAERAPLGQPRLLFSLRHSARTDQLWPAVIARGSGLSRKPCRDSFAEAISAKGIAASHLAPRAKKDAGKTAQELGTGSFA
jgi:hypothetical protein